MPCSCDTGFSFQVLLRFLPGGASSSIFYSTVPRFGAQYCPKASTFAQSFGFWRFLCSAGFELATYCSKNSPKPHFSALFIGWGQSVGRYQHLDGNCELILQWVWWR